MRCIVFAIAIWLSTTACKDDAKPRETPWQKAMKTCPGGELSCPRPIFAVRNLKASQSYYRDALGFKHDWEYGEPPDFASVSRSDTVVFLAEWDGPISGTWVMVFVKDVDKLHAEFVGRTAIVKMAPKNMPWGVREMHVADLDGNMIRFGGPTGESK